MKRYLIKMTAAFLSGALLAGCSVIPTYANSGEDPNPEEVITSFEELELIRPVDGSGLLTMKMRKKILPSRKPGSWMTSMQKRMSTRTTA